MSTDDDAFWPTRFINHRHGCDEKHSKRQPCNVPEETPVSTDDLIRRARAAARDGEYDTAALVSELADEVDRLRAENERLLGLKNDYHAHYVDAVDARVHAEIQRDEARAEADRFRTLWDRHGKNDLLAEVERLRTENETLADVEFVHNGCETIRRKDVQAVLDQRDAARAALGRVPETQTAQTCNI